MVPLPELRTSWHLCSLEPTEQWAAELPKSQTLFLWGFVRRKEPPRAPPDPWGTRFLWHSTPERRAGMGWHCSLGFRDTQAQPVPAGHLSWRALPQDGLQGGGFTILPLS